MIVSIKQIGNAGIIRDRPSHELPDNAFSDGVNVRFKDGTAGKILGDTAVVTAPAVAPYHLALYRAGGTSYFIEVGLAKVYSDNGTTQANITGTDLTGAASDIITSCTVNGVFAFTNSKDNPRFWGGTSNTANLTGWTSTDTIKGALRSFKNYLFACDLDHNGTRNPHEVKWSAAGVPGALPTVWAPAATNDAGYVDLVSEDNDYAIDMMQLGNGLAVYKQQSVFMATYIGGQSIFDFRRIPGQWGCMAKNCIAQTPRGHVVMSVGDVMLFDGQAGVSIANARVKKAIFDRIDQTYYYSSFAVVNSQNAEVWLCYPTTGNTLPNEAAIWNWEKDTWAFKTFANVSSGVNGPFSIADTKAWSGLSGSWEAQTWSWQGTAAPLSQSALYLVTTDKLIRKQDVSNDANGTPFTARLERTGLTFGDPERVKIVRSIYPRIEGTTGQTVYIQVGAAMDPEGSVTWSDPVSYVIGSTYKADAFAQGRLIAWRIYSTGSFAWKLSGSVDFDLVESGMY